jgi:hypothetical protein
VLVLFDEGDAAPSASCGCRATANRARTAARLAVPVQRVLIDEKVGEVLGF